MAERVQLQLIHDYSRLITHVLQAPGVWPSKAQNYSVGELLIMQAEIFSVKMYN